MYVIKAAGGPNSLSHLHSPAALISHIFQYNTDSEDNLKHFVFPRPLTTNGTIDELAEEEGEE
jgi:hypothetical protein